MIIFSIDRRRYCLLCPCCVQARPCNNPTVLGMSYCNYKQTGRRDFQVFWLDPGGEMSFRLCLNRDRGAVSYFSSWTVQINQAYWPVTGMTHLQQLLCPVFSSSSSPVILNITVTAAETHILKDQHRPIGGGIDEHMDWYVSYTAL